jgi:hypothetical protein
MLNDKKAGRAVAVATPLLQVGEQIELVSIANVGSVSVARRAATAAVAGVLSGGILMVSVRPRSFYLVLTNQHLLFFNADTASGRPEKKAAMCLPRHALRVSEPKRGLLTATFQMTISGDERGLKFVFPLPARDDAARIAAAVNGVAPLNGGNQ